MAENACGKEYLVRWKDGGIDTVRGEEVRTDEPGLVKIMSHEGKRGDPSFRQVAVAVFSLADVAGVVEKCCLVAPPPEPMPEPAPAKRRKE